MKTRNPYILITIVITLCLHAGCNRSDPAEVSPAAHLSSQQLSDVKSRAGLLFAKRDDLAKLREAVTILKNARDPNGRDYEIEWKFAKYNYFLGIHTNDADEASAAFADGRDAAKIASNMEPTRPDGIFWYAANLGEICKRNPFTVGIQSVDKVQEAMKRVIDLDPDYQGASAYDGLAQVELATRLKGGSVEKAVAYLKQALAIEDDNTNLHLHLAEAYLALDKDAEAKEQLQILLRMKPNPEYLPEHAMSVEAARKLLETRF